MNKTIFSKINNLKSAKKMKFKYLTGFLITNLYRLLRVFPNSDPIMGFVLPCAKNEKWWKAPLFAFATIFVFDIFTSGIGAWTWVTASTYATIAFAFHFYMKKRKSSLITFISIGTLGTLVFDFLTGPILSTFLFKQPFLVTLVLQIPFTIMHTLSAIFAIVLITPLLDPTIAKEVNGYYSTFINSLKNWKLQI